jgi:uncharacterized delta-60 repeat protein
MVTWQGYCLSGVYSETKTWEALSKPQKDGKIIAVGYSWGGSKAGHDFALVRYNSDGSLDDSFGGGVITTNLSGNGNDVIKDLAIQDNGKIVTVGYSEIASIDHFAIAVYLP